METDQAAGKDSSLLIWLSSVVANIDLLPATRDTIPKRSTKTGPLFGSACQQQIRTTRAQPITTGGFAQNPLHYQFAKWSG